VELFRPQGFHCPYLIEFIRLDDHVDPCYGEKKTLERITGMEVQALLVFSHAYVIDKVPTKRRGVTILPARMLAWYFSRQRPTMSVEEADQIYDRLCLAVGQPPSP
jgi:hypothetical protein